MQIEAARLNHIVDTLEPLLAACTEQESGEPALAGGWSRKQLIAHLIDSASNNHQRFVRASLADSLDFPAYDQEGNIAVQAPGDASWQVLCQLWSSYNRYLAHVIGKLSPSKLGVVCLIGTNPPVTLGFLVEDYIKHMEHHLAQIGIHP